MFTFIRYVLAASVLGFLFFGFTAKAAEFEQTHVIRNEADRQIIYAMGFEVARHEYALRNCGKFYDAFKISVSVTRYKDDSPDSLAGVLRAGIIAGMDAANDVPCGDPSLDFLAFNVRLSTANFRRWYREYIKDPKALE